MTFAHDSLIDVPKLKLTQRCCCAVINQDVFSGHMTMPASNRIRTVASSDSVMCPATPSCCEAHMHLSHRNIQKSSVIKHQTID